MGQLQSNAPESVFILGAGASKESGAPLMVEFLDVAEDLLVKGKFNDVDSVKIAKVFELISHLQEVYAKSNLDLINIEALFGAIEMAKIIGVSFGDGFVAEYKESLLTLITRTLEESISFPRSDQKIEPTSSYKSFVDLIDSKGVGTSSVLTFNYDIALDFALVSAQKQIDYGLEKDVEYFDNKDVARLLKLHGSTNWMQEKKDGKINVFPIEDIKTQHTWSSMKNYSKIKLSAYLNSFREQNKGLHLEESPVIVPPTWNKTQYHGMLSNVWTAAANDLNRAKNIFILGYSLPDSDSFFKYLFALGTMGGSRIRRFWVFDPDNSGRLGQRFKNLLGEGILPRFKLFNLNFSEAVTFLQVNLSRVDD